MNIFVRSLSTLSVLSLLTISNCCTGSTTRGRDWLCYRRRWPHSGPYSSHPRRNRDNASWLLQLPNSSRVKLVDLPDRKSLRQRSAILLFSVVFHHWCLLPINNVSTVHFMFTVEIHKTLKYIFVSNQNTLYQNITLYVFYMKIRINCPYIKLLLFFSLKCNKLVVLTFSRGKNAEYLQTNWRDWCSSESLEVKKLCFMQIFAFSNLSK